MMRRVALSGVVGIVLWSGYQVLLSPVAAERLESNSYVIQFGNFNVTAGEKESASYKVTDTVGQTGAGPYGAYGVSSYFIGGGFQYIYQIDQFSFSISKLAINLGELNTNVHNSDSLTLSISTGGAGGYSVYTYETRPLTHQDGTHAVADTICNSGSCSETTAGLWTNQSIGGFGFNANGSDVASDFVTTDHFRQFANRAAAESMQVIMNSSNVVENSTATITYKAGLSSASQAAGRYETATVFVAVPGF